MRSFMMQVILVMVMITCLFLAAKYWNTPLSSLKPILPEIAIRFEPSAERTRTNEPPAESRARVDNSSPSTALVSPNWLVAPRPTPSDYPERALKRGVSGYARVICMAKADGSVTDCLIAEESPEGMGFGESAMNIVPRGRLRPFDPSEEPQKFSVRVPFNID